MPSSRYFKELLDILHEDEQKELGELLLENSPQFVDILNSKKVIMAKKSQKENFKQEFRKRFESFLWNMGWMFAIGLLNVIIEALSSLEMQTGLVVALGGVLTQISKYINKTYYKK